MMVWLFVAIWIVWVLWTVVEVYGVYSFKKTLKNFPYASYTTAGSCVTIAYILLTIMWICYNIFGGA